MARIGVSAVSGSRFRAHPSHGSCLPEPRACRVWVRSRCASVGGEFRRRRCFLGRRPCRRVGLEVFVEERFMVSRGHCGREVGGQFEVQEEHLGRSRRCVGVQRARRANWDRCRSLYTSHAVAGQRPESIQPIDDRSIRTRRVPGSTLERARCSRPTRQSLVVGDANRRSACGFVGRPQQHRSPRRVWNLCRALVCIRCPKCVQDRARTVNSRRRESIERRGHALTRTPSTAAQAAAPT